MNGGLKPVVRVTLAAPRAAPGAAAPIIHPAKRPTAASCVSLLRIRAHVRPSDIVKAVTPVSVSDADTESVDNYKGTLCGRAISVCRASSHS